jgi:anti-sigma factor RsiW
MNCKTFSDRLHEYLDGALGAEDVAAVRQHLQHCEACRLALSHERAVATSLRQSFDQATAGISLRPEARRRILKALEPGPAPRASWLDFLKGLLATRRGIAAAALLGAVVFVLGTAYRHREAEDKALRNPVQDGRPTWVVDVPIQAEYHVFRRDHNEIVDSVAESSGIAFVGPSGGAETHP